ncbi:TetR/AcrR family transcriptional regulator [soil metagenome]
MWVAGRETLLTKRLLRMSRMRHAVNVTTTASRDSGAAARRRLLEAAVEAFGVRGYHATTTRDIAARARMSPAAVYVHHASKEELLYAISREGHEVTLRLIREAYQETDPVLRLRAVVRDFTVWHARRHAVARIVQYELSALTPEHFAVVAAVRHEIELVMRRTLQDGVDADVFEVRDLPGSALALLSLGIDVARWFRAGGATTADDLGELYADLAVRMVTPRSR